ncbi:hypothetical protein O2N63_09090 [Aliiroseovarius sp. KMU-50]|uniref:DUF4145 domain-containing protein n=1 Tax=Aliiroseovarius salicola TaxID=3009082 RepID=A0ABT4W157_9RHOB|nr:hypothetical protein [Aliiroseovarius sp. KMU-50]MDA5094242.1 hypothetical protein [Aliiroseovarius sp. KMU-50]
MIFSSEESREDILGYLENSSQAQDNLLAMACMGAAFCSICTFEDLVVGLITSSKAQIGKVPNSDAEAFLQRYETATGATLGKLISALEQSGIEGRDIAYLRAIARVRNDFIHRFMSNAPLPGDWDRYDFTLERFSSYTLYVQRHLLFAQSHLSKIFVKHGLLVGHFGSYGALLWHPDDPLQNCSDSTVEGTD